MDHKNSEVFSPLREHEEESGKRRTDSFSKFLKGPDVFKKISANTADVENVDQNTQFKKNTSKKSSKIHQKKTTKNDIPKSEETLGSSASTNETVFITSRGESSALKKDKSEHLISSAKGNNKDIAINFITKRNDKLKTNQQDEVDCKKARPDAHSNKKNSGKLVKSSLQSQTAVVQEPSESKDIKKTDEPSSMRQHNPLSQIQSGVFEKLINDAVESRFDDIQQLLYSQHFDLQKTIHVTMEKMEQRHASEQATLFKVIEALLEENRSLRNAILAGR